MTLILEFTDDDWNSAFNNNWDKFTLGGSPGKKGRGKKSSRGGKKSSKGSKKR